MSVRSRNTHTPPIRSPSYWLQVAGLVAAYWIMGWIAFRHGEPIDYAYKAVLWPPIGLGIVVLVLGGMRLWPGIALGAIVSSMTLGASRPLETHLLVALGTTLEVVLAACLFQRFVGRRSSLQSPHATLLFLLFVVVMAPIVGAMLGTVAFARAGIVHPSDLAYVFWAWWSGDAVSVLILTPWVLAWWESDSMAWTPRQTLEFTVLLGMLVLVCGFVFAGWLRPDVTYSYPLTYLPVLMVAWIASRFGFRGATTATLVVAIIAIGGTLSGRGPFVRPSYFETVLLLQAFIAIVSATMLLVNSLVISHRRSELALTRRSVEFAKAREFERLKDNILNAITHELRTPLTIIKGNVELLEDVEADEPEKLAFVHEIQGGVRRLERIVDDLLLASALYANKLELRLRETDLTELVTDHVTAWLPKAQAQGLTLILDRPEEPLWSWIDPERIDQALERLLDNAFKFTPAGGRVEITVSRLPNVAHLVIHDTGPGIPPEQLPHLFNRFYQVDPSLTRPHGGTGLGLAVAKAIVEAHGGSIGVESHPDKGSRFWLTLPLRPPTPAKPGQVSFLPSETTTRRVRDT